MFQVKIFTRKGNRVIYTGTVMISAYEFFTEMIYALEMSGGTATLDLTEDDKLRNQVYIQDGERIFDE